MRPHIIFVAWCSTCGMFRYLNEDDIPTFCSLHPQAFLETADDYHLWLLNVWAAAEEILRKGGAHA